MSHAKADPINKGRRSNKIPTVTLSATFLLIEQHLVTRSPELPEVVLPSYLEAI